MNRFLGGDDRMTAEENELDRSFIGGAGLGALARSLMGRSRVAGVLHNWSVARARIEGGLSFQIVQVNGGPGALVLDAQNRVAAALALEISDSQIQQVMSVVNPDKLAHLGAVSNFGELLRRGTQSER
jgi:hypothetical protein